MNKSQILTALALGVASASSFACATITINAIDANGIGRPLGTIEAQDGPEGLLLITDLAGLTPGEHGIHIHENGSCDPKEKDGKTVAGLAAGGHYDPEKTGRHEGPQGNGHKGDIPPLTVAADGTAKQQLIVPRLTTADIKNHALVIHEDGDNFSDQPKPLGGGGARVACGVVK